MNFGSIHVNDWSPVYIGVGLLALASLGAVCVLAYQYRYRRTTLSRALGVGFLFACALLVRFWPDKISAYWSGRNTPPLLQSIQLHPDADLKDVGRPGPAPAAPTQGRAAFYPFRATGLPADVGVVLVAIDAQFDAPGQKPAQVYPLVQARFQPTAAGAASFADASGPDQMVSFATNWPGDFERLKDSYGTVSGQLFLDGYRSTRVTMPVPPPNELRNFAIAGRRCEVTSYKRESKVALIFECAELEPGNTSRFQVRLLQNNQEMLPSQSQGETSTAGSWPAFLSPILKSSYQCEFQLPAVPGNSAAESSTGLELLVFSEETLGKVNRDFRIDHFRPAELDLRAWEQRGVVQADPTGAQSNNKISPK